MECLYKVLVNKYVYLGVYYMLRKTGRTHGKKHTHTHTNVYLMLWKTDRHTHMLTRKHTNVCVYIL